MISRFAALLFFLIATLMIAQAQNLDGISGYEFPMKKRFRGEPIRFGKRAPREPVRFGKRASYYPSHGFNAENEY